MTTSFFKSFLQLDFRPLFCSYRINTLSKSHILSSQASLPRHPHSKTALHTLNSVERAYDPLTHTQSLALFFQAFVHWFSSPYTVFCNVISNKFLILLLLLDVFHSSYSSLYKLHNFKYIFYLFLFCHAA